MIEQKYRIERNQEESQSEKFMDEIGAAMDRHAKGNKLNRALLESWVAAAEQKKRLRRKKYFAVAACFLLLCISAVSIGALLMPEDFEVTAGKKDPQLSEKGENAVIKDNHEGSELNIGTEAVRITNWEKVEQVKEDYPNLLIPEYIPEGYAFMSLSIEKSPLGERYTYRLEKQGVILQLVQENDHNLNVVKDYKRVIRNKNEIKIYINKEEGIKSGYCYIYNCLYTINGQIPDDEYKNIIDGLKR